MAYTRQYPNSITPQGTTTRGCLENDDKELKRVLDLLSNINGTQLSDTKRQCVLYGSTDTSGIPNFLTANGLNVSISGSTKPVIISFADGFSITNGTVDVLSPITVDIANAWTIPASSTYYLYVDKDISTGLLSYGITAKEDTYSSASPASPVLDQCYFNTVEMKMYHYNGSAWEQKLRVFVAKAVSTASAVTITPYNMTSRIPLSLLDPVLTGTPTAPTPDAATSNTQIATTEFSQPRDSVLTSLSGKDAIEIANIIFPKTAASHNSIPRGKDLTSYFTGGEMSTAIAAGTFDDIFIGDYITKSITLGSETYSKKWYVGDIDYFLHHGDTELTAHHVLMFPDSPIGTAIMNDADSTEGGYIGSKMWKTTIPLYTTAIQNSFGVSHVLPHREVITDSVSSTITSCAGGGIYGCSNSWEFATVLVNLFNENMVSGERNLSSSYFDVGDCENQISLMKLDSAKTFFRSNDDTNSIWLRSVMSSSMFCAHSGSYMPRGYTASSKIGILPYFLLK